MTDNNKTDPMESGSKVDDAQTEPNVDLVQGQIGKISLPRFSPFYRGRLAMWFMQIEIMFRRARITSLHLCLKKSHANSTLCLSWRNFSLAALKR